MGSDYDLNFVGADGADVTQPGVPGNVGSTGLDGKSGDETGFIFKKCKQRATDGISGSAGTTPVQAQTGGSGDDVPAVTVRCHTVSGPALNLLFRAGGGGQGGVGGKGGDGGAGGNAGSQPKKCAEDYGDSTGGIGGNARAGGQGGDAGDGGSAGAIRLVWDESIDQPFQAARVETGSQGQYGTGGDPGLPGQGGLNGDGKTRASSGGKASKGGYGGQGRDGKKSTLKSSTQKAPADQFVIVVEPPV